jgi:uncharacterized protein involved in outer membrane biogenesis
MARIGSATLSLALLPLLAQRIEVSQARLEGLELNLARNRAGAQQLAGLGTAATSRRSRRQHRPTAARARPPISTSALAPSRSRTHASSGTMPRQAAAWELTDFGMTAEDFGLGERFPLHIAVSGWPAPTWP